MTTALAYYLAGALSAIAVLVVACEWFGTENTRINHLLSDGLADIDIDQRESEMSDDHA